MLENEVYYQGRKALRNSSKKRRLEILQAALRVIARDGVRAVRHRAVAQEAGVPLSATTYYFQDIHALIVDAFVLYAEQTYADFVLPFWQETLAWLDGIDRQRLTDMGYYEEVVRELSRRGAHFIVTTALSQRERLLIETAFFYAALMDERLRQPALDYMQTLLDPLQKAMIHIGARDATLASHAVLAIMRQLQFEAMLAHGGDMDEERLCRAFTYQLYGQGAHHVG